MGGSLELLRKVSNLRCHYTNNSQGVIYVIISAGGVGHSFPHGLQPENLCTLVLDDKSLKIPLLLPLY